MSYIRGARVVETATLTSTKELHFSPALPFESILFQEECANAFRKGHESGEQIGYEKALDENKGWIGLLKNLTQKLLEARQKVLEQLKPEVIDLSLAICEKILRKELSCAEHLIQVLNSLLSIGDLSTQEVIKIVLAPEDLVLIEQLIEQLRYDRNEIGKILFKTDPLMCRGDCRIEYQSALLTYSIDREIAEIGAHIKYINE